MSNPNPWDNAPPPPAGGNFVKFEHAGTYVEGLISHVDPVGATTLAGAQCPLVVINGQVVSPTGTEADTAFMLSCSQTNLWSEITRAKPMVGQRIRVTFTNTEARPGGKTLKHFEVQLADGAPAPTPAPAANPEPFRAPAGQAFPAF